MQKKLFKAESKKLLDLMIHSIYTHREIFLRELISNASDAIDKRYYAAMQRGETGVDKSQFVIRLEPNREARTLTITDNGCGMSAAELESNLGTIAKSGTQAFRAEHGVGPALDARPREGDRAGGAALLRLGKRGFDGRAAGGGGGAGVQVLHGVGSFRVCGC